MSVRHIRPDDRGATAILVAISMVVLMGFAALVIDVGVGFNERRQDQSAADFGALAALQFGQPDVGCSGAACLTTAKTNGANEAIAVANASLDDPSAANWNDPASCATPPAGFTVSPVTDCVAFTSNLRRAWVRIPTIASPTSFGKLLGANSIAVSADAIADQGFSNPGPVLPFLLPGNAAGTDYNCLKTGPNPSWGVCEDLPAVGNFGSMDFFLFGDGPNRNTTQKCNGDTNGRLTSNIARGIDHPLGLHPTGVGPGIVEDQVCPILTAEPDMVRGQPGVGSALEDGLLYGGSSYSFDGTAWDGRIEDAGGFLVRNAGGGNPPARIDNRPLWDPLYFISTPGPCSNPTDPAAMINCINWAKSSGTEIFKVDIINSPRFGFTPGVWESDFLTPGSLYHIKEYRPVFMDTTYYGCNASSCLISHTPGVPDTGPCMAGPVLTTCGTPGAGNRTLNAVTAYILDKDILPDGAKTPSPGASNQRQYSLSE